MDRPQSPSTTAAPEASPVTVGVRELTTGYRQHLAVDNVSFEARAGRLVGVLGPNGSGKSTLVKSIMGLLKPWHGSIEVLGQDPKRARASMGYVPQAEDVDWDFPVTVADVVAMGLYKRSLGLDRFRPPEREPVMAALERMNAAHLAKRQVGELSGGQQRRVLLARAMVRNPQVLLFDEPAAGLDATAEEELLRLLREMADSGKTVIVATHDIQGVFDTYDDALLMNRHMVAFGPVAESMSDTALHEAFGRQLFVFHGHHHVEHSHEGGETHTH
jgi:ABC-type Mn2+/Zn2+ transport system ATPase subunit